MSFPTRRTVLSATVGVASALAGCGDAPAGSSESDESEGATGDAAGTATGDQPSATTTAPTETPTLDLREANVTAVELADESDGRYRFDVTFYHDVHKSVALVQPIRNL